MLRELGLSIGKRVRFRNSIASAQNTPEESPDQNQLLTDIFIDLVASTELSVCLHLEHSRQLILAFREVAEKSIAAHHGVVTRFAGDAVVAYFG